MPYFICQLDDRIGVVEAENRADAVLKYDLSVIGKDEQDMKITYADDSINAYCEQLLMVYDVTETYRAMVLEWVERRLDGDRSISIIL